MPYLNGFQTVFLGTQLKKTVDAHDPWGSRLGQGIGVWGSGADLPPAAPGQQRSRGAEAGFRPVLAPQTTLCPGSSQHQVQLLGRGAQAALHDSQQQTPLLPSPQFPANGSAKSVLRVGTAVLKLLLAASRVQHGVGTGRH